MRFSSIIPEAPNSRASSFYDDSETNVAACNFQSIWSRLSAQNLAAEKVTIFSLLVFRYFFFVNLQSQAAEAIERSQEAETNRTSRKFSHCFCCLRNTPMVIRSTLLSDERILIVALSKGEFVLQTNL